MTLQRSKRLLLAVPVLILTTWISITLAQQSQVKKIDDKALKDATKGSEWLSYGMGWSEQRYSTITQINADNVSKLSLAWSYEVGTGNAAGQKTNPLFSNGVLYGVTNWSVIYAVNARNGKEIWRYEPPIDPAMRQNPGQRLCCGVNSRGIALYDNKVFVGRLDGKLEALDAATGKVLWSSWAIPEPKQGEISSYSITMSPRAAKGKVFIGNAGGEFPPFRGYVSAFDANTGKELWKFYVTPGDPSKPFEQKAMEVAAKTWAGKWWEQGGGGSMWDGMAYDPDENLLYFGTGNGASWASDVRNGGKETAHLDNLYIASIVAVNADTGQYKWHYQCTPGDEWDYDAIQHLMLADIRINNRNRKVIMQANKNGYFYVIDRTNGEFISASEMAPVSWAESIDPKTGRPKIHPDALYSATKGTTVHPVQMHTTSPMAFNPTTGLVYVPIAADGTFSFAASADPFTATPGRQNFGLNLAGTRGGALPMGVPPTHGPVRKNADGSNVTGGILTAWDPATQTEKWFAPGGGNTNGGVLSTASNLVFQALTNGRVKVFTADAGKLLHEFSLPLNAGTGAPMTYTLDGKQYIAIMAGTTGAAAGGRGGPGGGGGAPGGPGRGGPGAPGPGGARGPGGAGVPGEVIPGVPGGTGRGAAAPGQGQEATAAATAAANRGAAPGAGGGGQGRGGAPGGGPGGRGGAPAAPPPPQAPLLPGATPPADNTNPKLFVYTMGR